MIKFSLPITTLKKKQNPTWKRLSHQFSGRNSTETSWEISNWKKTKSPSQLLFTQKSLFPMSFMELTREKCWYFRYCFRTLQRFITITQFNLERDQLVTYTLQRKSSLSQIIIAAYRFTILTSRVLFSKSKLLSLAFKKKPK